MDNAASQITEPSKAFKTIQERGGAPTTPDFTYCLPEHEASIIHVYPCERYPPFQREYNQCMEECA